MSNPFDNFAVDVQAALPPASSPFTDMGAPSPFGAPGPPAAPGPMMNAPPQHQFGYGAPPPTYGQQAPLPPQPVYDQNPFGSMAAPPAVPPVPEPVGPPPSDSFNAYEQQAPPMHGAPDAYSTGPPFVAPPNPEPSANPFALMSDQSAPAAAAPMYEAPPSGQYVDPWGSPSHTGVPPGAPPMQPVEGAAPGPPPFGAPPPPNQQPVAAPPQFGALPPSQPYPSQPYGMESLPPQDFAMGGGALVVSDQQSNPYAQQQPPFNPYGNPYGQPPVAYGGYHPQPPPPAPVDPFSVFESTPAPETSIVPAAPSALIPSDAGPVSDDEFWGSFAANNKEADSPDPAAASNDSLPVERAEEEKKGDDGLPPGGEWYDARIFTPTLGVMFFKPQELTDSLFLNTDKSIVDALGERPVVAFIVEGSSARSAGVELGHVLLKVNGIDVKNPKEASRLIKEGPRPLPLLFYVPTNDVVVAEGEHMVKYDTKETTAPNSAKDWKPKYVVIGGIISQPWMMNMYRSKSEYDIAVIETQARRPVSVKVKQFSLQGARIQNDWQGPQMVKYKNKVHPWKYIVVLPVARNPIKISSPNLAQLKPVHEGIRRVLLAQQRSRGGPAHSPATAPPVRERDPYSGSGRDRDQYNGRSSGQYDGRSSGQYDGRSSGGADHYEGRSNPYGPPVGAGDPYGGGGYAQPQQQAYRY